MATECEVSMRGLAEHLRGLHFARIVAWVVQHHTWRPTAAQWNGIATVRGIRLYHVHERDFSDNGYHVLIGPDGRVFLCRPMRRSGAHCVGRNGDSIGVGWILDGDREPFWGTPQHQAGVSVLALICARFGIDPLTHLGPHARWAPKSCPGRLVTEQWARLTREVRAAMVHEIAARPFWVSWAGTYLAAEDAELRDGSTWVRARPVAGIEGRAIHDRTGDLGKVFVA